MDNHSNFAYSTLATPPSGTGGTSLVVQTGHGSRFPAVPFNATIWPSGANPLSSNAEIVRVTNISTDTFTITRAQEGSTARTHAANYQIAATITKKVLNDIEFGAHGVINVKDPTYGAVGDGSTDDTAAVQAAFDAAGDDDLIYFPPATGYAVTGITLTDKSRVTIAGAGWQSKVLMRGSTDAAIFTVTRCNDIRIRDLWLYGNNVSASDGASGSAIYFTNASATANCVGWSVEGCRVENFKGGAWVRFQQTDASYTITRIRALDNVFVGGSDRDPTTIGVASAHVACRSTTAGLMSDILYRGNLCIANGVKQGLALISTASGGGFADVVIASNVVRDAGQDFYATVTGAYGIICYAGSNGALAQRVSITGNAVEDAVTCGIYVTYNRGTSITGNSINGQLDTDDSSLARAAIATTDCSDITITGNALKDNAFGIQVSNNTDTGSPGQVNAVISGNVVGGGTRGILLRYGGTNPVAGYAITGNTVVGQTHEGISLKRAAATTAANGLVCSNNTVIASTSPNTAYQGIGGSGKDMYGSRWSIIGNVVNGNGAATATAYSFVNTTTTGPDGIFANNIAYNVGALGFAMRATRFHMTDNVADTCGTSGSASTGAFNTRGAQGQYTGNIVVNHPASAFIIQTTADEDLGYDPPTWSGAPGMLVELITVDGYASPIVGAIARYRCMGTTTWAPFGRAEGAWLVKTGTYTVLDSDEGLFCGGTAWTLTLQGAASRKRPLKLRSTASGTVTVSAAGSDTVEGGASINLTTGAYMTLMPNGTDWLRIT